MGRKFPLLVNGFGSGLEENMQVIENCLERNQEKIV